MGPCCPRTWTADHFVDGDSQPTVNFENRSEELVLSKNIPNWEHSIRTVESQNKKLHI